MLEGPCTGQIFWGVGDHFQVLKVPEGTGEILEMVLGVEQIATEICHSCKDIKKGDDEITLRKHP